MSSIDAIKSKVRDLARPNLFMIEIFPPQGVPLIDKDVLDYCCQAAQFTSIGIKGTPLQRMGQKLDIPGDFEVGDLSLTFANDINFQVRGFWLNWINWMTNFEGTRGGDPLGSFVSKNQADSLKSSVTISYLMQDTFKPSYTIDLRHCWPKQISEISLSSTEESMFQTFTVTMGYSYFSTQNIVSSHPSLLAQLKGLVS